MQLPMIQILHKFFLSWSCLYSKGIISAITEALPFCGETQQLCNEVQKHFTVSQAQV